MKKDRLVANFRPHIHLKFPALLVLCLMCLRSKTVGSQSDIIIAASFTAISLKLLMLFPTGNFISSLDDAKEATELQPSFVKAILNGEKNRFENEVAWMSYPLWRYLCFQEFGPGF